MVGVVVVVVIVVVVVMVVELTFLSSYHCCQPVVSSLSVFFSVL